MRVWLHGLLTDSVTLTALLPGGVHAFDSFDSAPEDKPFAVHRAGETNPVYRDGPRTAVATTAFQVWVHDHPGDYLRIDAVMDEVRGLLEDAVGDLSNGLVKAEWLGVSEDFKDTDLNTAVRFCRFRAVHRIN